MPTKAKYPKPGTSRLEIWLTDAQKRFIRQEAQRAGTTMTKFILRNVLTAGRIHVEGDAP